MRTILLEMAEKAAPRAAEIECFAGEVPPLSFAYRGVELRRNREITAEEAKKFCSRDMPFLFFSFSGYGALAPSDAELFIQKIMTQAKTAPVPESWFFIYGRSRGAVDTRALVFASASF